MAFSDIQDISNREDEVVSPTGKSFSDIQDVSGLAPQGSDISESPFLTALSGKEFVSTIQPVEEEMDVEKFRTEGDVPRLDEEGNVIFEVEEKDTVLAEDSVKDNPRNFWDKANHTINYMGESFIMETAEMFDFFRKLNNWKNSGNWELPPLKVDGVTIENQAMADVLESEYLKIKTTLGGKGELEKPESSKDIFLGLLAQNMGPGVGLAALRKGFKKVAKESDEAINFGGELVQKKVTGLEDDVKDFLRSETKLAISGASVGALGADIMGGTVEDKAQSAQLFNLAGILGTPLIQRFSTVALAGRAYKHMKTNPIFNRSASYEMTDKTIKKHLAKLVPPKRVKEIEDRMRLVREIQKIPGAEEFKPTVGNLIGTEEARQVQRLVDSQNEGLATSQYLGTQDAVRALIKRFTTESDPASKAKIATALSIYADEASEFLRGLRDRMVMKEEQLRRVADEGFSASDTGENLRKSLKEMQSLYRKERDLLFDNIDPEGVIKVSPDRLINRVEEITGAGDPLLRIRKGQDGFNYFTEELPAIIRELTERSKPSAATSVSQGLGFVSKEKPHLKVADVIGIYKQLGAKAAEIRRKNPSSNTPNIMEAVQQDLLKSLDDQLGDVSDSLVARRYEEAREFMTNEYYNRFRHGTGGRLNERLASGEHRIQLDQVGEQFWKPNREIPIKEFNKIFKEVADSISPGDKEVASVVREMAVDSLKATALQSLQKEVDGSKDTLAAYERWLRKHEKSLKHFPELQTEVDDIGNELRAFELDKLSFSEKESELMENVISKFTDADPDKLMSDLFRMTPKEADRFLTDILKASQRTMDDLDVSLLPDYLRANDGSVGVTLDQSLRNAFQRHIVSKVLVDGDIDSKALIKILDGDKKELIETVLLPEEVSNLRDFAQAIKIMGAENVPSTKPELNAIKAMLSDFGISPASILARYYSASLGKVGPLYLITDAMTRMLTGVSKKHFEEVYRNTMYDLEGLESVLKHMGQPDDAAIAADFRTILKNQSGNLKKGLHQKIKDQVSAKLALLGYKVNVALEERDKDHGTLAENFLASNDEFTGQKSRIRGVIEEDITPPQIFSNAEANSLPDVTPVFDSSEEAQHALSILNQDKPSKEDVMKAQKWAGLRGKAVDGIIGPVTRLAIVAKSNPSFREDFSMNIAPDLLQVTEGTGIFPETLAAMTALETGWGVNVKGNSYFGVKAKKGDKNAIEFATKEADESGNLVAISDRFQTFQDFKASAEGVVTFLVENPRYKKAGVFDASTPEEQLKAIAKAGYATDPKYAEKTASTLSRIAPMIEMARTEMPTVTSEEVTEESLILGPDPITDKELSSEVLPDPITDKELAEGDKFVESLEEADKTVDRVRPTPLDFDEVERETSEVNRQSNRVKAGKEESRKRLENLLSQASMERRRRNESGSLLQLKKALEEFSDEDLEELF